MIHHVSWGNHPQPQDFRVVNYYKQAKPALFQESSPNGGGFPQRKPSSVFGVPSIYLVGGLEHDFSFPKYMG
jgi:hypothetical protein